MELSITNAAIYAEEAYNWCCCLRCTRDSSLTVDPPHLTLLALTVDCVALTSHHSPLTFITPADGVHHDSFTLD